MGSKFIYQRENKWKNYLFLHEFGHSFGGLADEYYTSSVAYDDFYPLGVEPAEPNITAQTDREKLKWKHLLADGIEVPAPWRKDEFDGLSNDWQKKRKDLNKVISDLKAKGASEEDLSKAQDVFDSTESYYTNRIDNFFKDSKYLGKIGVYEGAGYISKGLYRATVDGMMFSRGIKAYGKVSEEAIIKKIKFFSE